MRHEMEAVLQAKAYPSPLAPPAPYIQDATRSGALRAEFDGMLLDYSRQRVTAETMALLERLAVAAGLQGKIRAMAAGAKLNLTENRSVLHMALRAPRDKVRWLPFSRCFR
jgi:hypothetical protein